MKAKFLLLALVVLVTTSVSAQNRVFETVELTTEIKGINGKYINSTDKVNIVIEISDSEISIIKDINSKWRVLNKQVIGENALYLAKTGRDHTVVFILTKSKIIILDDQITLTYLLLKK